MACFTWLVWFTSPERKSTCWQEYAGIVARFSGFFYLLTPRS